MTVAHVEDEEAGLYIWRVDANIKNKQSRKLTMGGPTARRYRARPKHLIIETDHVNNCMISGFLHEVGEHCALLGYYATSSGNCLPTFRDTL